MGRQSTSERIWFLLGLFFSTLAALALEMLDTRLLSVITWYHLSFFAVSVAMLGMSAAAVHVFLGGERFQGLRARQALANFSLLFAVSIPVSHVCSLCIPMDVDTSLTAASGLVLGTLVLAVPFFLAGFLVTIALTRVGDKIGLVYAVDLIGASLGSLLVIPLLYWFDISSAVFAIAGVAALSAWCFQRLAEVRRLNWTSALLVAVLFAAAVLNSSTIHGFRVRFAKSDLIKTSDILHEAWNSHSQVIAKKPVERPPFYFSATPPPGLTVQLVGLWIDGNAFTGITGWDGKVSSLSWVERDVTTVPHHLRRGGDAGVIGVGGGRDVLSALWAENRTVTGIEINGVILGLDQGPLRDFAKFPDCPGVTLIHDEARSYLTRQQNRFDVLQMSLVDTWAATGAGAFTLSCTHLTPGGFF
jgi:hypothetical protein